MKKFTLIASILLIAQVLFAGFASAAYQSQYDKSINIKLPINLSIKGTAELTYNLQESVHNSLNQTTGLSIDYFYIWINVNDQPVAAIDPAKFMY